MAPCRVCVLDLVRGQLQRRGRPGVASILPPPACVPCCQHHLPRSRRGQERPAAPCVTVSVWPPAAAPMRSVRLPSASSSRSSRRRRLRRREAIATWPCLTARATAVRQGAPSCRLHVKARPGAVPWIAALTRGQGAAPSRRWRRRLVTGTSLQGFFPLSGLLPLFRHLFLLLATTSLATTSLARCPQRLYRSSPACAAAPWPYRCSLHGPPSRVPCCQAHLFYSRRCQA